MLGRFFPSISGEPFTLLLEQCFAFIPVEVIERLELFFKVGLPVFHWRAAPFVENLLNGKVGSETFDVVVRQHEDNHASLEKSIAELKNIIIKYYPNDSAAQLMGEVLMDIFMTEEDLLTHCHMEDTLFAECVRRLEFKVRQAGGTEVESEEEDDDKNASSSNDLSEREKDIVVQVAKGLSNKEIADALFISVNTVMTHRRNISRKLQIHSPAALTIYALVNGLVSLDEIAI